MLTIINTCCEKDESFMHWTIKSHFMGPEAYHVKKTILDVAWFVTQHPNVAWMMTSRLVMSHSL